MKTIFNRTPLVPNSQAPLCVGAIRPEGWLRTQMEKQLRGLTGRAVALLRAGDLEAEWEKKWQLLDALVPLAWEMEREDLKELVSREMRKLLDSQREDGWFGPEDNSDYWPRMLALRALWQYFTATADRQALKFMDAFFKYQFRNLAEHPLKERAVARGAENMLLAMRLFNLTGQMYLLELCRKLREQTLDWPNFFHTFSLTQPLGKTLRWERLKEALEEEIDDPIAGEHRPYFHTQYHLTHGENLAFGLKSPGIMNLFKSGFKEQGGFRFGWEKLIKHHGVACGCYTCDQHINGASPSQGVEIAAIAELLNALETLIGIGDYGKDLPDLLEKLAFNALPAAFSQEMEHVQRVQQVNQVSISRAKRAFYNEEEDANLFLDRAGEEFSLCAQQGWPKFVSSLWMGTSDDGLAAVSYAPCTVRVRVGEQPVRVRVFGEYPFSETVSIEVTVKKPLEFPMYLRIPQWVRQPMIVLPDGEMMQVRAGETACVRRRWQPGDIVRLELNSSPRITRWYHQSAAVELGPLLMAFAPASVKEGERVRATEDWNWALLREEPMKAVFSQSPQGFAQGEPGARVLVKAAKTPWTMSGESCGSVPVMPGLEANEVKTLELVPYGATELRIAQFPVGNFYNAQTTE